MQNNGGVVREHLWSVRGNRVVTVGVTGLMASAHLTVFYWQLLSAESHDSGRGSVMGRSVQQIVTKGTGVVQQFIRHR